MEIYQNELGRWFYTGRFMGRMAMGVGATLEKARADYLDECEVIETELYGCRERVA